LSNKNFVVRNGITVGTWNLVDENGNLNVNTLNILSGLPSLNVTSFTATTITAANYGNITANTVTANNFGNVTANSFSYADGTGPGFTYFLDDISGAFNGVDVTFPLSSNGQPLTPTNPNQLLIKVGNVPVLPLIYGIDYFNLALTSKALSRLSYPGFTISGNTITFSSPPMAGMGFFGYMQNTNDKQQPFTLKTVPFDEINIMFSY
jgi:hypothetical protein